MRSKYPVPLLHAPLLHVFFNCWIYCYNVDNNNKYTE